MKRSLTLAALILCMWLLCMSRPTAFAQTASTKPNVVFILVDNVGWGDFSSYGGTVPTPRIDSISTDGLRFNNYTLEAQSTPSRAAIPTGPPPLRAGTMRVPPPREGGAGPCPAEATPGQPLS